NTARGSRPDTVLGPGRSRAQAGSLPSILQPGSLSHRTGRAHAGSEERCTFASDRTPRFVSLAPTLQRPLSDPGCRLNWNSPHTGGGISARLFFTRAALPLLKQLWPAPRKLSRNEVESVA